MWLIVPATAGWCQSPLCRIVKKTNCVAYDNIRVFSLCLSDHHLEFLLLYWIKHYNYNQGHYHKCSPVPHTTPPIPLWQICIRIVWTSLGLIVGQDTCTFHVNDLTTGGFHAYVLNTCVLAVGLRTTIRKSQRAEILAGTHFRDVSKTFGRWPIKCELMQKWARETGGRW